MRAISEEIRRRVSIRSVVSSRVALKQAGNGEFIGLCPFHQEKTPSFTVSEKKGFYYCFGCQASGDAISFVSHTENMTYLDAIKKFASELAIQLPANNKFKQEYDQYSKIVEINEFVAKYYQHQLSGVMGERARNYLKNRGITEQSIKFFRIGYSPVNNSELQAQLLQQFAKQDLLNSKIFRIDEFGHYKFFFNNRLMFPIMNSRKEVVGFGGRRLIDNPDTPKYINSPETPVFKKAEVLYGEHALDYRELVEKGAIFTEGYLDVIALNQLGYKRGIAPLGTAIKPEHLKKMWQKTDNIVLMLDSDIAGQNAVSKLVHAILPDIKSGYMLNIATTAPYKDVDELARNSGVYGIEVVLNSAKSLSKYLFDSVVGVCKVKSPEQKAKERKELEELASQFTDETLKREFGYYFKSELYRSNAPTKLKAQVVREEKPAVTICELDTEAVIIALIALHPELLESRKTLDDLMHLEITDPFLESLRSKLLHSFENNHSHCSEIFNIASGKYNLEFVKNIENTDYYVIRLFKLITLRNISRDVMQASHDLSALQTEEAFVRLLNLKKIEEELKIELGIV